MAESKQKEVSDVDLLRFYETSGNIIIFGIDNKAIGIDLKDANLPGDFKNKHMTILWRADNGFNQTAKKRMEELRDEWITKENDGKNKIGFTITPWAKSTAMKIHGQLHDLCIYCRTNFYDQQWIPHVQIFNKM